MIVSSINLEWLQNYLSEISVGLICIIVGALLGNYLQVFFARKKRTQELIAEKRVPACDEALQLISKLRSLLMQDIMKGCLEFMREQDKWFWQNIAFLPSEFSDRWLSIKLNLRRAIRMDIVQDKMEDGPDRDEKIEEVGSLETFSDQLAEEAEVAIRNELGLPPTTIHKLKKPKRQ